MELRHLRSFLAVAADLHFRRAAERLHLAQPALSQQIRELEAALGAPLFDRRTRRQVRLTPAGEELLAHLPAALAHLETACDRVRRLARGELGRLSIGFPTPLAYGPLPGLIHAFRAAHPRVDVTLHELPTAQQEQALRDGALDLGFGYPPLASPGLRTRGLWREPLLAALADTHPLAAGAAPLPLARLAPEPFLLFPRDHSPGLYDRIVALCRRHGFAPRVEQTVFQLPTALALVAAGMGVTLVPASLGRLQRPGLVYRRLTEARSEIQTAMLWSPERDSVLLDRFRALAVRTAAAVPTA